jgi:hypothetical protein
MSKLVSGKYLKVHERNIYFSHVTTMLMYYHDHPRFENTVIILGDYITYPISYFRSLYPGCKIIVYQLEQLVGGSNWHPIDKTIANMVGADELWDYDVYNAAFLKWRGIVIDQLRPMRYTPTLHYNLESVEPDIDILFYGYANPKRAQYLDMIQKYLYGRGNFVHVFGIFGQELDKLIQRSKVILNLHAFDPFHRQEQVRIFYPLINGKCVLSEKSQGNWFGTMIVEFTEQTLVPSIEQCLKNWKETGLLGGYRFQASVNEYDYMEQIMRYKEGVK